MANNSQQDYEVQRLENIRRNQALLLQLGIDSYATSLDETKPKTKAVRRSATKRKAEPGADQSEYRDGGSSQGSDDDQDEQDRKSRKKGKRPAVSPTRRSSRLQSLPEDPTAASGSQLKEKIENNTLRKPLKKLSNPSSGRASTRAASPIEYAGDEENAGEWRASIPSRQPVPKRRGGRGTIRFEKGYWHFTPNVTPSEMFAEGAFGGGAWKKHYSAVLHRKLDPKEELAESDTLPMSQFLSDVKSGWRKDKEWVERYLTSGTYRTEVNKFGVKSGQTLAEWESAGWIRKQDPRGWWQWYLNFYYGRRSPDDERQISRWQNAVGPKGRFRKALATKIYQAGGEWDDPTINPIVRQTLWHWGVDLTEDMYLQYL